MAGASDQLFSWLSHRRGRAPFSCRSLAGAAGKAGRGGHLPIPLSRLVGEAACCVGMGADACIASVVPAHDTDVAWNASGKSKLRLYVLDVGHDHGALLFEQRWGAVPASVGTVASKMGGPQASVQCEDQRPSKAASSPMWRECRIGDHCYAPTGQLNWPQATYKSLLGGLMYRYEEQQPLNPLLRDL